MIILLFGAKLGLSSSRVSVRAFTAPEASSIRCTRKAPPSITDCP